MSKIGEAVVKALEGDAFDHSGFLQTDAYGEPYDPPFTVYVDGMISPERIARAVVDTLPTYHELRLAEAMQRDAREFAGKAELYRDAALVSRVRTMSRALNVRMCNEYAAKAADMARRARVLMGVEE